MFIVYGIIAIVFLLIGFYVGAHKHKKDVDIEPPSCLNCTNLLWHKQKIDCYEFHYNCNRFGHFNNPPDECGYYNRSTNQSKIHKAKNIRFTDIDKVVQCKNCEYWMPDGENRKVCTGPMAYCNTDKEWYCASAKRKD